MTRAAASGVDPRAIIASSREVVGRDVVGVWTASGGVQGVYESNRRVKYEY